MLNLNNKKYFNEEYMRLKKKYPNQISNLMFVNFMFPYNFFIIKDPDGNLIEIADA